RGERRRNQIVLRLLRAGDEAEQALGGPHHHGAGSLFRIVHEAVERHFRLRTDAEVGVVEKDQLRVAREPGAEEFVLKDFAADREGPRVAAKEPFHPVADGRGGADPVRRGGWSSMAGGKCRDAERQKQTTRNHRHASSPLSATLRRKAARPTEQCRKAYRSPGLAATPVF